ncbi:hypothetical protein [Gracilibacillus salinarum]|uniref:Uncharacterized protein n=1 Tax=Gracilibacillus salinarum TaxID=2932255 RepID=A0ABY4GS24_9BACI|nr:hypothetical protein [Gracilibacillus salinarum]UOQ87188.1 hypothetical protein MUN87_10020 [Gracilibacillus salinarum]
MNSFTLTVFLWQICLVLSIVMVLFGLFKKSWLFMLISMFTSLPIAYYFSGANNGWKMVAAIPFSCLYLHCIIGSDETPA